MLLVEGTPGIPSAPLFYVPASLSCGSATLFSLRPALDHTPMMLVPLRACLPVDPSTLALGGVMAQAWHGPTLTDHTLNLGPLALVAPLLQRLDIAAIIDRHLPPDPQLTFSHGRVLSLLLAARLCQPTALINIPAWVANTGADLLWDMPADSLNDDRLGRALDAFFTQRHSILTAVAAQALQLAELPRDRLHFDPTHLFFYGAYASSQPRPATGHWPPTADTEVPPA